MIETLDDAARLAQLCAAEDQALALLDAIAAAGIVTPGRRESEVDADIAVIAARDFGIARDWHQRLVRAGPNTMCIFSDMPAERVIGADETVYLDLGPVFGAWEADVGQTYAMGGKGPQADLVAALPDLFEKVCDAARAHPDISGAALYELACAGAAARGYLFGGKIAGHTIGEFPHLRWPGERDHTRIAPGNPTSLRDPDHLGRKRHWIVEIHLIAPDRSFGGFYERLLRPA